MNKEQEHRSFGETITGSRWFKGEPTIVDGEWKCPIKGCEGVMKINGRMWLTTDPGIHHTCSDCDFQAALKESRMKVGG